MLTAILSSSVSLLVVVLGFVSTYLNNLRLERHRNQLERVNRQLSELYGPMFALTQASGRSFKAFSNRFDPLGLFDDEFSEGDERITEMQKDAWRLWVRTVFQPNNKELVRLLLSKADLLVDGEMPESAQTLFVHVSGFDVVLKEWDNAQDRDMFSIVDYPGAFTSYVHDSYQVLQRRQTGSSGFRVRGGRSAAATGCGS